MLFEVSEAFAFIPFKDHIILVHILCLLSSYPYLQTVKVYRS
jgi:hypothetical protein